MTSYIARRLLQMVPIMLLISMISFALIFVLPGDPAQLILGDQATGDPEVYRALRKELGLDRPVPIQYVDWLSKTLRGDLGMSTRDRMPVTQGIQERLPVTLELVTIAMLLALLIALPTGIISAIRPNSRWDMALSVFSLGGVAMPSFWLGILLIYGLAVNTKLLPPSGYVPPTQDLMQNLVRMVLPTITLALGLSAATMRQVRSSLLEVLQEDYVTTARAKGLGERTVIVRHALRNSLIPVVTVIGLQVGLLFGGAVITESIFAVPGIGRWAVDSILQRDFPVVQAVCLVMATGVLFVNLLADVAYAYIDPRVRYN
jgi:peptide/nickel transport system permease protein